MSKSNTGAPWCKVCENNHSPRDPHKWDEKESKKIVQTLKDKITKCVHKPKKTSKKGVHKKKAPNEVYTVLPVQSPRTVNMRLLRSNIANELKDLPFDIIKNGKVIARVDKI